MSIELPKPIADYVAANARLDADAMLTASNDAAIKAELKTNTDEVAQRGGFGSPTMFVADSMFFGNDRLPLVRAALEKL